MKYKKLRKQKISGKSEKNHTPSTLENLHKLFEGCGDVKFHKLVDQEGKPFHLVYCQGLYDKRKLDQLVIPSFMRILNNHATESTLSFEEIEEKLETPVSIVENNEQIISRVFNGEILIMIGEDLLLTVDISDHPQRSPEEPNSELSIKGARDGFVEEIQVNMALIRKRLRTNTLNYEQFVLGKRTHTKVGLLYIEDIIDMDIITELKERISKIDIDGVINSTQLKELLKESPFTILPTIGDTGRPDFAVDCLLRGRFVIIIDGVPTILIGPANLFFLFRSGEDNEFNFLFNSFERLLRISGLLISTFLPGMWIALITIHQDQIPFSLLATLIESRKGVPLPSAMEAIIMLLLFSLFREAGLRLPKTIGQTLSVIGGLIIGDAAIRAGLTNPAMLVVIAASEIATYTLGNISLTGIVNVLRIFIIILSGTFGVWGLFLSFALLSIYGAHLRPFGIPYLAPFTYKKPVTLLNTYFRLPWKLLHTRPGFLKPQDPTKGGEDG
ncbi:spore germination protein [Pseudalkalibacillus caeni]|uniref:Spore germination protein n=1 Tax=Exobacillus caeni TaxID=2574798 RepID=A0A5R9F8F8_9BACL|nr:spore germination protein [Pseudalkalibacillus caeni]TLS37133.1 spore germination protein [Pseudalkalibacillus caeni]